MSGRLIFAPEDAVSLSLEYLPPGADPLTILLSTNDDTNNLNASNNQTNSSNNGNNNSNSNGIGNHSANTTSNRRYLQCPALVTIAHLKKFLALKYSVDMTRYNIEICHRRAPLPEHWTLMDVAYIYAWKRVNYSQFQLSNILTRWLARCKIHLSQDVKMCSRYKTMIHEIRFSRFDQIKALKNRSISMITQTFLIRQLRYLIAMILGSILSTSKSRYIVRSQRVTWQRVKRFKRFFG